MVDLSGLALGISKGLESGAKTYVDISQREADRALKRQQLEQEMMLRGYVKDESGNWTEGPGLIGEREARGSLNKAKLGYYEAQTQAAKWAPFLKSDEYDIIGTDEIGRPQKVFNAKGLAKIRDLEAAAAQKQAGAFKTGQEGLVVVPKATADIGKTTAQTETEKKRPGLIEAQTLTEREKPALIRAQAKKAQATASISKQRQSVGTAALDRDFAKEYNDYVVKGGRATAEKGLQQLREARNELASGAARTGVVSGLVPERVRSFVMPKTAATQQKIMDNVVTSLRPILGAQFTENEGIRIQKLSFDPALSNEENIKKLDLMINRLEKMKASKDAAVEHFDASGGTLAGFNGSLDFSNIGKAHQTKQKETDDGPFYVGQRVTNSRTGITRTYKGGGYKNPKNWE